MVRNNRGEITQHHNQPINDPKIPHPDHRLRYHPRRTLPRMRPPSPQTRPPPHHRHVRHLPAHPRTTLQTLPQMARPKMAQPPHPRFPRRPRQRRRRACVRRPLTTQVAARSQFRALQCRCRAPFCEVEAAGGGVGSDSECCQECVLWG